MAPEESERRGWRDDGSRPSVRELVLAFAIVVIIVVGALVLLGGQLSQVLMTNSGTV